MTTRYNPTQTSKAILTNAEALDLAKRLKESASHDLYLAQALYQTATPALINELESLIYLANWLRSEPQSEEEEAIKKYLQTSDRQFIPRSVRRQFKITR